MLAGFLAMGVARVPWEMVAFGRFSATWIPWSVPGIVAEKDVPVNSGSSVYRYCTYVGEGMNVSVAVTKSTSGWLYFHGAGKVQASSDPQDMRLQRMLGHLSVLARSNPDEVKDVLVVACGAGVTAGSFVPYPYIQRITICDIEPLVPKVVTPMFGKENYHIVDGIDKENPRRVNGKEVKVVYDDGRHYIRTLPREEKFDIITSDPIDPWVKGCAALNTIEYYQMCRDHLKPGGVMSLWIPLYESNIETAKSVIATFFQVFPNGILFSNDTNGEGYDAVLLGQVEPTVIDLDALQARLDSGDYWPREGVPDGSRIYRQGRKCRAGSRQSRSRGGPACHLCRASGRPEGVDEGCSDQHRPEFAAAVSGRNVAQFLHRHGNPEQHPRALPVP